MNLTQARIDAAACPEGKSEILLWDSDVPGLVVRVRPSGAKVFAFRYRPAGMGRAGTVKKVTLGDAGALSLKEARQRAKVLAGNVAGGADPRAEALAVRQEAAAEKRESEADKGRLLSTVLDTYEDDLKARKVVNREHYLSALRRLLLKPLGDLDVRDLTRPRLVQHFRELAREKPGAAAALRTRVAVLLNWCVNEGLLSASPLAGYRNPRRTRAEIVEQAGRALSDAEIPVVWNAAAETDDPFFMGYLRTVMLTGQRRTETALMTWTNVDFDAATWTIPMSVTKSGRAHKVPLPPQVVDIVKSMPRLAGTDFVFPGRAKAPMSGFSKRLLPVRAVTDAAGLDPWSLHDLRRTMRTGLGRLGVAPHVAELLLNHAVSDELARIYDRGEHWQERAAAAAAWAQHVSDLVAGSGTVVALPVKRRASA